MDTTILEFLQQRFDELQNNLQKHILLSGKNVLTVKELATLTGLSVGYIYNLVSSQKIPHYKSDGGKLTFFKKSEVEAWLCATRVPTYTEVEQQAIAYCVGNNKKGGKL